MEGNQGGSQRPCQQPRSPVQQERCVVLPDRRRGSHMNASNKVHPTRVTRVPVIRLGVTGSVTMGRLSTKHSPETSISARAHHCTGCTNGSFQILPVWRGVGNRAGHTRIFPQHRAVAGGSRRRLSCLAALRPRWRRPHRLLLACCAP